jgi:hypothetical protein
MTKGEVAKAVREALHRLDEWQEATGALEGGYEGEAASIVEDAVHIGIRAALGLLYVGLEDAALRTEAEG